MNGSVAAGTPADSLHDKTGVIWVPENDGTGNRQLRMAFDAQIGVALDEKLVVDGTMRLVTDGAAFSQRLMLEDIRARLLPVAPKAGLVHTTHKGSLGQEDICSMRIMAADAGEAALPHRMVVLEAEEHFRRWMALKTDRRILFRIDDRFPRSPSGFHVKTARAMTGLTAQNFNTLFQQDSEP